MVSRLGLLKGDQERQADWVVILASGSIGFARGRDYYGLVKSTVAKIKRRSANTKVVVVVPEGANLAEREQLSKFSDAYVDFSVADRDIAGLDGIFVPGELAYVAIADAEGDGAPFPTQNTLLTIDADIVSEISRRIFSCAAFNQLHSARGMDEKEWNTLRRKLLARTVEAEARVLRLKPKKLP